MIDSRQEAILRAVVEEQPHPVLFATVSGAHLYGFASPDSDIDLRGVHVRPLREVIGLDRGVETFNWTRIVEGYEVDLVTHDVAKFFHLLLKRDGTAIEQVMSPLVISTSAVHEEIKHLIPQCITKNHAHHYLGFANTEWGLVAKVEKPKVKPLLYVYRVLLTGIHLMRSREMEMDLRNLLQIYPNPEVSALIEFKTTGAEFALLESFDFPHHRAAFERLRNELESARGDSALPETPSARSALNELLVKLRLGASITSS